MLRSEPPAPSWAGCLFLLALLAPSSLPSAASAQMDKQCALEAGPWADLAVLKRAATPEQVADAYTEAFAIKGAGRDAQAIWRRMEDAGETIEEAVDAHFARYYADRPQAELSEMRGEVLGQIQALDTIRELVIGFESAKLTPDYAADVMAASWRAWRSWGAPEPIEHYRDMIVRTAQDYIAAGQTPGQAAARAAAQVRAVVDSQRGAPRSAIIAEGHPCFDGEVSKMEIWLRHKANGEPTAEEREAGADGARLTWYTHWKFGPRDYSFDRLEAWRIAAEAAASSQ